MKRIIYDEDVDDDLVSQLIRETLVATTGVAKDTFAFLINHSSNALHSKSRECAANPTAESLFEWLSDLAVNICDVDARRVSLDADQLWVSKKLVFNLAELKKYRPALVDQLVESSDRLFTKTRKTGASNDATALSGYRYNEGVKRTLQEIDFAGMFVEYLFFNIPFGSYFKNSRDFMRQFLSYCRAHAKDVHILECVHESVVFSWSMKFAADGPHTKEPWNQTWRQFTGRFAQNQKNMANIGEELCSFKGQRHLAYDFFDVVDLHTKNNVDGLLSLLSKGKIAKGHHHLAKTFVAGAWVFGAGNNRLRSWLSLQKGWSHLCKWTSFVVVYADPVFLDAESRNIKTIAKHADPRFEKLKLFFSVAALVHDMAEAFDCSMATWLHVAAGADSTQLLVLKPNLRHVVRRVARNAKNLRPSEKVCQAVLDSADAFVQKAAEKAKKNTVHPQRVMRESCIKRPFDGCKTEILSKLKAEACVSELDRWPKIVQNAENKTILCFEHGGAVSWIDALYTTRTLWDQTPPESVSVFGTTREFFVVICDETLRELLASDETIPPFYDHPLSSLRNIESVHHPLWSARQEMLELCV